jgi:HK97 gp10 family phage protein
VTETVQVLGLRELREALLKTVPAHFQGKVLQKALSAGAKPIVRAAKQLAPAGKTGVLRRAIYSYRDKRSSNGSFEQRAVGVRSGKRQQKSNRDAFYWRFIEFGRGAYTSRHGVLGTEAKGFFGHSVAAVIARPFLRPAFDQNKPQTLEEITKSLAAEIPKAAKKAAWPIPSK